MERSCPACESGTSTTLLALRAVEFCERNETYARDFDRVLGISRDEVFPIVRCDCGFVYAKRLPGFLPRVYREVIRPTNNTPAWFGHQLGLASQLLGALRSGRVRILDYGCGQGTLVRAIRGPTIDAVGYDPNTPEFAAKPVGPFDGIILSDVLEHIPDPRETLAECRALGRVLIVNVPVFDKLDPANREVNPWEHLNYFSGASLRAMLKAAGFSEVARNRKERLRNWLARSSGRVLVH